MNYSALQKNLFSEVFSGKQYALLPPAIRVLAFIGMLPFIIIAFSYTISYAIYNFIFNVLSAGVAYLENWVHEERRSVKPATEAVLYFITAPTIFFMQVLLSLFAIAFFFIWFFLQCVLYIATLGGIRFQPYINHASFGKVTDGFTASSNPVALLVVSVIAFSLYALYFIFIFAALLGAYDLGAVAVVIYIFYLLFVLIAIPVCARKKAGTDADASSYDEEELELPEVVK